jgi:hypothetical protein
MAIPGTGCECCGAGTGDWRTLQYASYTEAEEAACSSVLGAVTGIMATTLPDAAKVNALQKVLHPKSIFYKLGQKGGKSKSKGTGQGSKDGKGKDTGKGSGQGKGKDPDIGNFGGSGKGKGKDELDLDDMILDPELLRFMDPDFVPDFESTDDSEAAEEGKGGKDGKNKGMGQLALTGAPLDKGKGKMLALANSPWNLPSG